MKRGDKTAAPPQQQQQPPSVTRNSGPVNGTLSYEKLYPSTVDSLDELSLSRGAQVPRSPTSADQNALKLSNVGSSGGSELYSDMPLPPVPPPSGGSSGSRMSQPPPPPQQSPPAIPLPNAPGTTSSSPNSGAATPKSPAFDDISAITYLDLSSSTSTIQMINSTGRLPRWLQKCTSLQYLVCKGLGLTVVDDWVSEKLTHLKVIRLNDNRITTWPDHLARLLPYGQLQIVELEGNPCMELQFRKSLSFYALYQEANGPTLTAATLKKYKKRITESPEDYLNKLYKGQGGAKLEKKNSGSSTVSGGGGGGGGLFSRRRKKSKEKEEEDDMLKKKTSFSKFRFGQESNSSSTTSVVDDAPPPATILESPNPSAPDRWANQRIEPSELERSKIVIQLLADIYELSNRNIRNIVPPERNSSKKQSSGGHDRMNSVDVMQHFLSDREASELMRTSVSTISNIHSTISLLEHFITEERKFIHRLEQFSKIYLSDHSTPARKIAPCFKFIPEILRFHSDTLVDLFDAALERLRRHEDENMVLETLGTRIVSIVDEFHWYLDYSLVAEEAKRKVRFYRSIRKIDSSNYTAHGVALTSYAPTQQHPDCDVGDWLRARQKHPEHALSSCTSYMSLPFVRLLEYREFFNKLSDETPGMHSAAETMDNLVKEIEYRKPIELRKRRHAELQRTLKLKDIYGKFICDVSVIIQSKVTLEPLANPASKLADAIHRPIDDASINLPTSLTKKVYDTTRPETGTLLRFVVFETTVLIIDDQRRNIVKQTTRNEVSSNIPESLSDPGGTLVAEVASNTGSNSGSTNTGSGATDETSVLIKGNMDSQTILSNILRVVFYDSLEVYYCGVRSSRGGDRDTFVRTLNATLTSS
ncbi:hypothetical protein TRICI_001433 [Trichomonascus ciferrii]|uniref:DH domain-containing protein n=1 Tax=Trichomonascus ciferrii TaxID=44093 RepID=A0A642V9D1_9ASCO|nr:hypothetical protein TRICI_001433 [Trichomonascus ciferrii]